MAENILLKKSGISLDHDGLSDMPDTGGTVSDHDTRYDARYLKLDGSNANSNIDIGAYDFAAAHIFLGDGTVGAPSIAFADETNTGIFRDDNGGYPILNFTIGGHYPGTRVRIGEIYGFQIKDTLSTQFLAIAPGGTELTGVRTLTLDVGNAARTISLTGNPTLADWFDQSVKTGGSPIFVRTYEGAGTALLPSFSFNGDPNTGIWRSAADTLNISTGGVERFEIDATSADFTVPIVTSGVVVATGLYAESGTAALPSIAFHNPADGDTGIWRSAADTLNISTAGVERFEIDAASADFVPPVHAPSFLLDGTASRGILDTGIGNTQVGHSANTFFDIRAASMYFKRGGVWMLKFLSTEFSPYSNNAIDLGASATRWKTVYSIDGDFSGRIISATKTITASADNTDVSGVNIMFVNITSNITLGGLTGGVDGQVLHIVYKGNYTATCKVEDTEGVGDQDIYTHTRLDETIDGGGYTLVCDGGNWYDCSHARHV